MHKAHWEEPVEAVANALFYLFALFIVILPPLAWLENVFSGREGAGWVVAAIIVFGGIGVLARVFSGLFADVLDRIRQGDLLRWLFVPLRAFSAVLGIYGVLKLEYFAIHGMPEAGGASWSDIIWQFLTAL